VNIRPAVAADLPAIRQLLTAAALDARGVEACLATTLVGEQGGRLVAAGSLEPVDGSFLLRSLAVDPDYRGRGEGRRLALRLLDLAGGLGAGEAWLLTTTAADFFAALGFSRVPRDAAPPAVRATEQFARLCPESAVLMRLRLAMLAPPRITR